MFHLVYKVRDIAVLSFLRSILTEMRLDVAVHSSIKCIVVIFTVVIATIASQALLLCDVWPSTFNSARNIFRLTAI